MKVHCGNNIGEIPILGTRLEQNTLFFGFLGGSYTTKEEKRRIKAKILGITKNYNYRFEKAFPKIYYKFSGDVFIVFPYSKRKKRQNQFHE